MVEQGVVEIISNLADSYQEVTIHHLQVLQIHLHIIANAILSLIYTFFSCFFINFSLSIK